MPARDDAIPGSATLFALRAIGIVFLARWLYSMTENGFIGTLQGMGSSPFAMLHLIYLFLMIALPGARPGPRHPFQPLPRWLRQVLRAMSVLGALFALFSIAYFAYQAGFDPLVQAVKQSNGWLLAVPCLYLFAAWLCRRRPLWRSRAAVGHYSVGCLSVAIDHDARTATVWDQNRKVGQYGAHELSVHEVPLPLLMIWTRIDLIWSSLAAAGHNRRRVFRVYIVKASDKASARALGNALKRV